MNTYKIPPLNLSAVVLDRLTWLAKMGKYQDDFISILEAPKDILKEEDNNKVVH